MPLPPQVAGPLTVLSQGVWVNGVSKGAQIQLRSNGTPLGAPAPVTAPSTFIAVPAGALVAGASITATQTLAGATSEASPFGQTVAGLPPGGLPAPVFLSGLHTAVDWVYLGGLFPGATVEVRYRGQVVGRAVAGSPNESVPVRFPVLPTAGEMLEATQFATTASGTTVRGPTTESLPLASRGREMPLPALTLAAPLECDLAILVSGLVDGASLVVNHGADELAGYPFMGSPIWANLRKPALPGETFTAVQKLTQNGLVSPPSAPPTPVNNQAALPTPVFGGPYCPDAQRIELHQLRPGATVSISAVRRNTSGGGSSVFLGSFWAWATDCGVDLPLGWVLHPQLQEAGKLFLEVVQENCTKTSGKGESAVAPLSNGAERPVLAPIPIACAQWVQGTKLTPGTVVEVVSDQADWPQLTSPPIPVTSATMTLAVNRPLRAGERLFLRQTGCSAAADSASVEVAVFTGVSQPRVKDPVRIPHGGAWVSGLQLGARVHVFRDGVWQVSLDVVAETMFVPLSGLKRETAVTALQTMCSVKSTLSPVARATLGQLALEISPSPITRTVATTIRVTALDVDTKQPVAGTVTIGSTTVGMTGKDFAHTFALGAAPPSAVNAPEYHTAPITWNLKDPAPVQPPRFLLSIINQAGNTFAIDSVHWDVYLQVAGNVTPLAAADGLSAVIPLTTSNVGASVHIIATAVVHDALGDSYYADFKGNGLSSVNGQPSFLRVVTNGDSNIVFRLVNVLAYVPNGQGGTIALPTATVEYHSG